MKNLKKILAVCSFCTLLTTANCFAMSLEDTQLSKDQTTCYKVYQVMENEQNIFLQMLSKEIEVDGNKYEYVNYTTEGGNTSTTIDINTTKTIISTTKDKNSIIEQLGSTLEYNEDGFIGTYNLNTENLKITTNYNGYREDLIEKTITYTDLEKNDLDFIPKETTKDGITLNLLKVDWEIQTTKNIGEYEIPDKYIAKCYYAGKQRIDYPNTYTVTAEYFGTATKIEEHPITYKVEYKQVIQEDTPVEEKNNNILPIVGGSTGTILVIMLLFFGNVTVYNFKDGKWVKVGKTRINRNKTIKLNRFSIMEQSNKYKIKLSKGLTKKLKGKMITISKNGVEVKLLVNSADDAQYTFEVRI